MLRLAAGSFALGAPAPLVMHHIASCSECGRPAKGSPGSWCELPPNCTAFTWDDRYQKGDDLSVPGRCADLACDAQTYCFGGGGDLWAATNASVPPCSHPPVFPTLSPTPPPPPGFSSGGVWHLPARCEEGDVNALFQFKGVYHIMQQWHARPLTSVGHAVSTDLLHWSRVADVLSAPSSSEQCFDGSSSIVTTSQYDARTGTTSRRTTPMLMIDGGCGKKGPGSKGCMESSGNGSTGGVTAFPDDLTDPNLTVWTRQGPTIFNKCDGSAGPSPILRNAQTGKAQLIAIHGHGEALFEAIDGSFTKWTMVDPTFLPQRGGGGGLWHVLPPPLDGVRAVRSAPAWTHIMQLDGVDGDGGSTFALLVVDPTTSNVTKLSSIAALDVSQGVKFGQLSNSPDPHDAAADSRTLRIAWLESARHGGGCTGADIDTSQLTCFRDIRYDSRLGVQHGPGQGGLVELPIAEYLQLRSAAPVNVTRTKVAAMGKEAVAVLTYPLTLAGNTTGAHDIELNISGVAPSSSVLYGIGCGSGGGSCFCVIAITVNASSGQGTMRIGGSAQTSTGTKDEIATFDVLPGETSLDVRVMIDIGSIEIFAMHGRAVYSGSFAYDVATPPRPAEVRATVTSAGSSAEISAAVWSLASIR